MEELLSGLVRVMEERLGRFGRLLTTVLVLSLALGGIAWGLKSFYDNAIWPLTQLIQGILDNRGTSEDLKRHALSSGIYIIGLVILSFVFLIVYHKTIRQPAMRVAEFYQQKTGACISELKTYISNAEKAGQYAIKAQEMAEKQIKIAEDLASELKLGAEKEDSQP